MSIFERKKKIFHVSFTFLVLLFWTFLVCFSGPPTPICQKEQKNHKIRPEMSRIGTRKVKETQNSIFLVEFSGNVGRNIFLTSITSQKIFQPYFQKSRLECYFLCLFYFSSPYSGHLRSDFVVLMLLLTDRSRRTRKADQKCPEKQDKKSKRDMKNLFLFFLYKSEQAASFCTVDRARTFCF